MSRGHGIIPYGDPSYSIQVDAMVGDCLEAQDIFDDITFNKYWKEYLDFLDDHGIRREKLVRFYRDFCGSNKEVFFMTLGAISSTSGFLRKNYTEPELDCNWGLNNPVPFYDKKIRIAGVDPLKKMNDSYFSDKHMSETYRESHKRFIAALKQAVKEQYYSSMEDKQPNISIEDMISTTNLVVNVSEGIPECVEAVLGILDYDGDYGGDYGGEKKVVLKFDHLGIMGDVLRKFYVDGCGEEKQSLLRVMCMINQNLISYDDVLLNLSLEHPLPFLDKDIVFNGRWDLDFSERKEFLRNNAEAFLKKLQNVPKDSFGKMVKRSSPSILDSIINRLSNGNQQVRDILYSFSSNYRFLNGAVFFENNDIIGEDILKLFNCHNEDPDMFYWTVKLFLDGFFPVEAIKKNLALAKPLPFINMDIVQPSDRCKFTFDIDYEEYRKRMQDNVENFLWCLKQMEKLQQTSYDSTPEVINMAPQKLFDLIMALSGGDKNIALFITKLITEEAKPAFKYCYELGITGEKFSKFYNNGCCSDMSKFYLILEMFKRGVYSKDIIQMNLTLPTPAPFIRESSEILSPPRPFGEKPYAYAHPFWEVQFKNWKDDFLEDFGGRLMLDVSENLRDAAQIATSILRKKTRDGVQDLMFCKTNNITGNRIIKLYKSCCLESEELLAATLDHLETGAVPATIITNNLDLEHPISFLNDNFLEEYRAARADSNNSGYHN